MNLRPTIRFLNRDTIEEAGGLNLYAYCRNNGVNGYDRLGMIFAANDDTPAAGARRYLADPNNVDSFEGGDLVGMLDGLASLQSFGTPFDPASIGLKNTYRLSYSDGTSVDVKATSMAGAIAAGGNTPAPISGAENLAGQASPGSAGRSPLAQIGDNNCNYSAALWMISVPESESLPTERDLAWKVAGQLGISFADANVGLSPDQFTNGLVPVLNSSYFADLRVRKIDGMSAARESARFQLFGFLDSGEPMLAARFSDSGNGHTIFLQGLPNTSPGNVLYVNPANGEAKIIDYSAASKEYFKSPLDTYMIAIKNSVPTPRFMGN